MLGEENATNHVRSHCIDLVKHRTEQVAACDLTLPPPMPRRLAEAWFRPHCALTLISLQLTGNPPGGQPAELGFGGGHLIQNALSPVPQADPLQMQDYSSATGNKSPIAPLCAVNVNSHHGREKQHICCGTSVSCWRRACNAGLVSPCLGCTSYYWISDYDIM